MKWRADFRIGHLDMPGFGRCPLGYECSVVAATRAAAVAEATRKAVEFDSRSKLSSLQEVFLFAVKIRGRDKRKREEFVIEAVTEDEARKRIVKRPGVYAFAGHKPEILSVRNAGHA